MTPDVAGNNIQNYSVRAFLNTRLSPGPLFVASSVILASFVFPPRNDCSYETVSTDKSELMTHFFRVNELRGNLCAVLRPKQRF